jgi:hypothetical protein
MSALVKPIAVQGMKELQRALKDLDGQSQKEIRVALNTVAETVAQGAARRVPRRTGRARATLRAMSSQTETRISAGGRKAEYYGWLDFGGRVGRDKSVERPFIKRGRYIWPTVAANRDGLAEAVEKALVDLARAKGLEVG